MTAKENLFVNANLEIGYLRDTNMYQEMCFFIEKVSISWPTHSATLQHCLMPLLLQFCYFNGKTCILNGTTSHLLEDLSLMVPKHLSWSMLHFSTANQYQQSLFSQMTSHAWRCRSLFYNKSSHQNIRYAILDYWERSLTSIHR